MVDPKPTGARFRQRELPGGDAGAFVRDRLNQRPTQYEAIMEIKAPATKVKEHVAHWGTVEPVTDETCRLIMKVDSFEWPTVVLGVIGAEFTVVGPPELKDYIREMGKALLRSTEG